MSMSAHDAGTSVSALRSESVGVSVSTRTSKVKHDAAKRNAAKLAAMADKDMERRVTVRHQDDTAADGDKARDRTPQPLLSAKTNASGTAPKLVRRGIAAGATGSDRRHSVQTGEGPSVSRTSQSEERSVSQMEGSSEGSDHISSSTPDDYTGEMDDSTSESYSMERSSATGPSHRRQSMVSSADGTSLMGHERGDHHHDKHRGDRAGAKDKHEDEGPDRNVPRLQILSKHVGRKPPPKPSDVAAMKDWKNTEVVVTLTETPIIFHLSRPDEAVVNDQSTAAQQVRDRNDRYRKFLRDKKENELGGKYLDRGVTTLNDPSFSAKSLAVPPHMVNSGGIQVTTYDLFDEMMKANEEEVEIEEGVKAEAAQEDAAVEDDAGAREGEEDGGAGGDDDEGADGGGAAGPTSPKKKRHAAWMSSPSLLETVLIVERCIVMNNYEELQLEYRGLKMESLVDHLPTDNVTKPSSPNEKDKRRRDYTSVLQSEEREAAEEARRKEEAQREADERAALDKKNQSKARVLWTFSSEKTRGKNVSCLAWNRKNPDILASGYGEYGVPGVDGSAAKGYGGVVCCWSVKNPFTPERVIQLETDAGVSALHFSKTHPSLLAVGNTDGTLALYDVRVHGNSPALKTTVSTGQHTGTVWEVRWVQKGQEEGSGETLVSCSADGHVMEWSIKKGLERTSDLMKLKRAPAALTDNHASAIPGKQGNQKEAVLARQSGGMCFDMHPVEPTTYVVGTEDGTIHQCSKSQNESYVATYKPHGEPVYRIRWNQFCPDFFITGSADWTSRLYHKDKLDPLTTYDSNEQDAVQDLCWSHARATVFATATAHGRVDVWDVSDPNKVQTTLDLGRQLNCVAFAEQESPLLTCGDVNGDVSVIKLSGDEFTRGGRTREQQAADFRAAIKDVALT
jgi:WD40 repeat protein